MMMVMLVMIMLTTTTMMMMVMMMPEKSETRQRTSAVGDGGAEHTGSKFLASTLENSFILAGDKGDFVWCNGRATWVRSGWRKCVKA